MDSKLSAVASKLALFAVYLFSKFSG